MTQVNCVNYCVEIHVLSSCDVSPQALKATESAVCSHSEQIPTTLRKSSPMRRTSLKRQANTSGYSCCEKKNVILSFCFSLYQL